MRKGLAENNRNYVYGLLVMCQTLCSVLSISLICTAALYKLSMILVSVLWLLKEVKKSVQGHMAKK